MKTIKITLLSTVLLFLFLFCSGQNSKPRSFVSENIINEIIGKASGERAMTTIYDLAAYNHDRSPAEYSGHFVETEYIYKKLKEYDLEDVKIDKYPGGTQWDGIRGEVWEISPGKSKIADYGDITAMLAQGSASCNVTGELIWIGDGRKEDVDRVNVEGKIVVTSGNLQLAYSLAVPKGALGVISYESPHPLATPLAIPFHTSNYSITGNTGNNSIKKEPAKFGFLLPPREGNLLHDRLLSREKITVHVIVESQNHDYNLEVITGMIKGTDPSAGEIILSAHLFDGLVKMGANDNMSGCASILEIARFLSNMIKEGLIEKPKRSIRFIFAQEISGTAAWAKDHKDIIKNTLCNINLDMVGLWLSKNQSLLYMHRTEFGNPHYINDIMENCYNFVGLGNKNVLGISGNMWRIVAPSGSDDPFYYSISDYAAGSDHDVFSDWGVKVPGIMMITWPDPYYHTSQDNADKCDPTQLKRICVIGATAAYTIAWADESMSMKIASEVSGNAFGRIGKQLTRAIDELDKVKKDEFEAIYKKSKGYIESAIINEKATIKSTSQLVPNSPTFSSLLTKETAAIDEAGKAALINFDSYAYGKSKVLGLPGIIFKQTELELKAKSIIPKETSLVIESGYKGYTEVLARLDPKVREKYPVPGRGMNLVEIGRLCNGTNSVLDIKKTLDTQISQGEIDLQNIINYIYILKEAGLITLQK